MADLNTLAPSVGMPGLTLAMSSHFAGHVLLSVRREYPNKLDHVLASDADVQGPRGLHPAFYGCFDWHSCVHGHWMLARLLRTFPDLPEGPAILAVLEEHLAPGPISVEAAYFRDPNHQSFERTYGWAWLLKLAAELLAWDTPQARLWARQLEPLTLAVAEAFHTYLPKLTYPIRTGVHPNTAFSLSLALDYARAARDARLEALLVERSRAYYGQDADGPLAWEPSGEEFLSPCLEEAALMGKVLEPEAFRTWLAGFLPRLLDGGILAPARVSDRTDPKIVHLDGLNLSRARCLHALASRLGPADPRAARLERLWEEHAGSALPHVISGNYVGDHWLATFAVHMLGA